jgi:3-methylfumaryl-CoA hydratase
MSIELDAWRKWIGRTERRTDVVTAAPLVALSALLDRNDEAPTAGAPIPPLAHWLYFMPMARQSELGPDGHPARGGLLPPVTLPRRMWAGSRLQFDRPLRVGEAATRISRVVDVDVRRGKAGPLVFVVVRHEIASDDGVAITEEHDIVYRDMPKTSDLPAAPIAAPRDEAYAREIDPDPVLLFRYSAVTFNGHRIHYDRSYATEVEGYAGLVVHGPLIATLLVDLFRRHHPGADIRRYAFKAVRPIFDIDRFTVCGKPSEERRHALWARNGSGALAMESTVEIS